MNTGAFKWSFLCLLVAVTSCVAGSDNQEPPTASTTQALSVPGLDPEPCTDEGEPTWRGTPVQLMVADAWSECFLPPAGPVQGINPIGGYEDEYLAEVKELMTSAYPQFAHAPVALWVINRGPRSCDFASDGRSTPVRLERLGEPFHLHFAFPNATAVDGDIRTATTNLCIAQKLRQRSPGVSGAQALLLSSEQQRELASVIRERSQIAMLQYGVLLSVLAAPDPTSSEEVPGADPSDERQRMANLNVWGDTVPALVEAAERWGVQLAEAVQLHVAATEELAELIARSRSAGLDTPSLLSKINPNSTSVERTWGAGSWQNRLIALFYGGDPFRPLLPGINGLTPWSMPFHPTTEMDSPEVHLVLDLAKTRSLLRLSYASTLTCDTIRLGESARRLREGLQQTLCAEENGQYTEGRCELGGQSVDLLWSRFRINDEHVERAVGHLADHVRDQSGDFNLTVPSGKPELTQFPCARDGAGRLVATGGVSLDSSRNELVFSAAFDGVTAPVKVSLLQMLANVRLPTANEVSLLADATDQGLSYLPGADRRISADEIKRILGASTALMYTRGMLKAAASSARPAARAFLGTTLASTTMDLIDAALGKEAVSVEPVTTPPSLAGGLVNTSGPWKVTVESATDAFWQGNGTIRIASLPASAWLQAMTLDPTSSYLGQSLTTMLGAASAHTVVMSRNPASPIPRWEGELSSFQMGVNNFTKVLIAYKADAPLTDRQNYRVIADSIETVSVRHQTVRQREGNEPGFVFPVLGPIRKYVFGRGGRFGDYLEKQLSFDPKHPTEPLYDGFGLPTNWVPPLSAELLGGTAGESSVRYFLDAADVAAEDSVGAVRTAFEGLLQQQEESIRNQVSRDAARQREQRGLQEAQERLCGLSNPACQISMREVSPDPAWFPSLQELPQDASCDLPEPPSPRPGGPAEPHVAYLRAVVNCLLGGAVQSTLDGRFSLASPVEGAVTSDSVPGFSAFSGGALQSALIEQWRAVRDLEEQFAILKTTRDAVFARMYAAQQQVKLAAAEAQSQCSGAAFGRAAASSFSVSTSLLGIGWSFNPGPMMAQIDRCESATRALPVENANAIASFKDSIAGLVSALQGMATRQAALGNSGAQISSLINETEVAKKRVVLEAALSQADVIDTASFGLVRRLRDADLWRAKALLEGARRYALTARRAVEAHYVVNLSQMAKDEAFVRNPSGWADEIYEYDLSLPSAIGLEVGTASGNTIFANKIKDYVRNLRSFVNGYAATRPSAVSRADIDVVQLPGLAPGEPLSGDDGFSQLFSQRGSWQVRCPSGEWRALPEVADALAEACPSGRPLTARLTFNLDPWGRVNRSHVEPPYANRYNGRWSNLAVNVVGTGVRDCNQAQDRAACYAEGFVRYRLTQVGRPWITNYEGQWRDINLPIGVVDGGKALAAELWLDPLKDGWGTSYIGPIARTELTNRPLGGAYQLEIDAGPDFRLENVERVQLMIGSTYWVAERAFPEEPIIQGAGNPTGGAGGTTGAGGGSNMGGSGGNTAAGGTGGTPSGGGGTGGGTGGTGVGGGSGMPGGERTRNGLVALYEFNEGSGYDVYDVSGVAPPMDLGIDDDFPVIWQDGALSLDGSRAIVGTDGAATKFIDAARASNAFTVELWISDSDAGRSGSTANIASLMSSETALNFSLFQVDDWHGAKLRTSSTATDGLPILMTGRDFGSRDLRHLVFARAADGNEVLYVNGVARSSATRGGTLSTWSRSYPFRLGSPAAAGNTHSWIGTLHLAALYSRALVVQEVQQNYAAGPGD